MNIKKWSAGIKYVVGLLAMVLALTMGHFYEANNDAENLLTENSQTGELLPQNESGADIILIGGLDFQKMTAQEIHEAIAALYPWNVQVICRDNTYEVPNFIEEEVVRLVSEGEGGGGSYLLLPIAVLKKAAINWVKQAVPQWEQPAAVASLTGYDGNSGTFIIQSGDNGWKADADSLTSELLLAMEERRFETVINVSTQEAEAEGGGMAAAYTTLGACTTKTTSNSNRNTNILLSAQILNGTIIKPGEVFSFNEVVGQRTSAKGYKKASAYSNGEVVQEVGGGVCQVSTTLYNAVVASGLETINRKSHTFKPSYITPGMDATVSWGGPDYQFQNNSPYAVGIQASFANQELTISLFGIPVLTDGVEYSLESKKTADLGVPAPVYVEDKSLPPGTVVVRKNGTSGSKWATYLVIKQNGEVLSRELAHTASYKGHSGLVARNSAASVPVETVAPEEPAAPAPEAPTIPVPVAPEAPGPGAESPPVSAPAGPVIPQQEGPGAFGSPAQE